mmetsp:Transcript_104683/g.327582  ORF Transcript_104683/g.327582 Transcript_104683/m.327582 type:complete len:256 (-) Transcript_104683:267-1034(-)
MAEGDLWEDLFGGDEPQAAPAPAQAEAAPARAAEGKEKKEKKEKKERKEKKEAKEAKEKKEHIQNVPTDSDAESDDSDAGKAKRRSLGEMEFDDEGTKDIVCAIRTMVQEKKMGTPDEFLQVLRMHQLASCFDHKTRLYIALEALCGPEMDVQAVSDKAKVISKCIENAKMEAHDVLWAFGAYFVMSKSALKGYPWVLKAVYMVDWADNEDDGAEDPGFTEAKQSATPFLNWLATAESEDDEGEEVEVDGDGEDD